MKLTFVVVAYQGKEGPVYLAADAVAVDSYQDAVQAMADLAKPLVEGGETILAQLFVTVPDELMAEVINHVDGK
jgi:hypothetical protein